jgi:tricorn protease-like protein
MKIIRIFLSVVILVLSVTACQQFQESQDILLSPSLTNTPLPTDAPTITPTADNPPVETPSLTPSPAGVESQIIGLNNSVNLQEIAKVFQSEPYRVVWAVDGLSFGVISRSQIVLFNSQTLKTTAAFSIQEPVQLLDFSSDGLTAAVTSDQATIELWDIPQNKIIKTIKPTSMFTTALFSPDGRTLLVNSMDEFAAILFEVNSGELIRKYTGFETAAPIYSVSFSDNGQMIIWLARAEVQLTDIATGKISQPFSHEDFINSVAVSPNNQLLLTSVSKTIDGNLTPTIQLWNISTGADQGYILTKNIAYDLAFSNDGTILAFADGKSLILYDVVQKKQIISLEGHSDSINSLSLSPDGTILTTTSFDNSIRLWKIK